MPTTYANPMNSTQYEGCLVRMIAAGLKARCAPAPFGAENWIVRDANGNMVRFTMGRENVRRVDTSEFTDAQRAIVATLVRIDVMQVGSR